MGDEEDDRGPWIAIGRIIGPALPAGEITIGRVRIIPTALVPDQSMRRLPKSPLPVPRMAFEEETSVPWRDLGPDYRKDTEGTGAAERHQSSTPTPG